MRARRSWSAVLALTLLAVAGPACRDSGGDDGVNPIDGGDGDGSNPDDMKIQDVQNDATPVGTAVTLRRVVVVAIDKYGNRTGNFYVMEPEGGAFSGVLVFGAPLAQVDALAVGDLVDITDAEKDEFAPQGDLTGQTVTELKGAGGGMMTVTKVGTGAVPAPQTIDALAIGRLPEAMRRIEQEKWEHVLVKVENVTVTSGVRHIPGTVDDPTFNAFRVTGYWEVDSGLSEIALTPPAVTAGECLASVTGMGDYFYQYKVLPRAVGDIVKNGTGCPTPEMTAGECGDMIDNDANGFADCLDNSCRAAVPACTTSTTIAMVQNGTIPTNSTVMLSNVVVTAIAAPRTMAMPPEANPRSIWVADDLAAAPYTGVQIFRGTSPPALPAGVVVGARVSVVGHVAEFNDMGNVGLSLTEIDRIAMMPTTPTITVVSAPAGLPTPLTGISIADLTTDPPAAMPYGNAERYEGSLVEIRDVKVTTAADNFGQRRFTGPGGTSFISVNDIASVTETNDTCYAMIRGIWTFQVNFNNNVGSWAIAPLGGAANTMTGGTCN